MSFLEHLEELRWHLIRSFGAILVFAIAIGVNIQWFLEDVILAPFKPEFWTHAVLCRFREALCFDKIDVDLIAISPSEQFLKAITISLVAGFIFAFPVFIWEMWRFIKPGLHKHERKGLRGNVLVMSLLFFTGVAFAYYIITPFSIRFFSTFSIAPGIENQWKIGKVISLISNIALGGGIIFEMPVLVYYLSKMGLVTPGFMRSYRRHAIVVLLILAAMITPPDWITQVLIFIPLIILYEISIRISAMVTKKQDAAFEAAGTGMHAEEDSTEKSGK